MVVNLTEKILDSVCESALKKGLSFVPTTSCNPFKTYIDFQKFFTNLTLKEFFVSVGKNDSIDVRGNDNISNNYFKTECDFIPPKNRNVFLETFIGLVEKDG